MTAYFRGLVPGVLAPLSGQGNDYRLDMVSFEYQVLGLRALKIVGLPLHPLQQENTPLFIRVLIQPPSPSVCFISPIAQVSSDSECSLLPFL